MTPLCLEIGGLGGKSDCPIVKCSQLALGARKSSGEFGPVVVEFVENSVRVESDDERNSYHIFL